MVLCKKSEENKFQMHRSLSRFYFMKRLGSKGLFGFSDSSCGTSPLLVNGSSFDGRGDWDLRRDAAAPSIFRGTWKKRSTESSSSVRRHHGQISYWKKVDSSRQHWTTGHWWRLCWSSSLDWPVPFSDISFHPAQRDRKVLRGENGSDAIYMNLLQLFLIGSDGLLQRCDQFQILFSRLSIPIPTFGFAQSNQSQASDSVRMSAEVTEIGDRSRVSSVVRELWRILPTVVFARDREFSSVHAVCRPVLDGSVLRDVWKGRSVALVAIPSCFPTSFLSLLRCARVASLCYASRSPRDSSPLVLAVQKDRADIDRCVFVWWSNHWSSLQCVDRLLAPKHPPLFFALGWEERRTNLDLRDLQCSIELKTNGR